MAPNADRIVIDAVGTTRPGLLSGLVSSQMMTPWSPDALVARVGRTKIFVEYSLAAIYRPRPEINAGKYFETTMTFEDAVTAVACDLHYATRFYISTVEIGTSLPELEPLVPPLVDGSGRAPARHILFIGNKGTGSHCHFDVPDNIVLVLGGRKQFWLFPPSLAAALRPYPTSTTCSNISSLSDAEVMRLAPYGIPIDARAGDGVYIPAGWWHRIVNSESATSVSCLWYQPGRHDGTDHAPPVQPSHE